jgi:hypothetical protein
MPRSPSRGSSPARRRLYPAHSVACEARAYHVPAIFAVESPASWSCSSGRTAHPQGRSRCGCPVASARSCTSSVSALRRCGRSRGGSVSAYDATYLAQHRAGLPIACGDRPLSSAALGGRQARGLRRRRLLRMVGGTEVMTAGMVWPGLSGAKPGNLPEGRSGCAGWRAYRRAVRLALGGWAFRSIRRTVELSVRRCLGNASQLEFE